MKFNRIFFVFVVIILSSLSFVFVHSSQEVDVLSNVFQQITQEKLDSNGADENNDSRKFETPQSEELLYGSVEDAENLLDNSSRENIDFLTADIIKDSKTREHHSLFEVEYEILSQSDLSLITIVAVTVLSISVISLASFLIYLMSMQIVSKNTLPEVIRSSVASSIWKNAGDILDHELTKKLVIDAFGREVDFSTDPHLAKPRIKKVAGNIPPSSGQTMSDARPTRVYAGGPPMGIASKLYKNYDFKEISSCTR